MWRGSVDNIKKYHSSGADILTLKYNIRDEVLQILKHYGYFLKEQKLLIYIQLYEFESLYFAQACRSNDFLGIEQIRVKCPYSSALLETLQSLDQ
jgi:hypothetical protein